MHDNDDFHSGLQALESLIAADRSDSTIDARCVPRVRHHGHATDRAVVLFHGFTNCPQQFAELAELLFARGFNVYVPRLPRHGLTDKLTTALDALTVAELIESASAAVLLAAPLARRLTVMGLSLGATMVAWIAQTQAIEAAIAIAPFFSVAHVPSLLEPALAGTLEAVPNLELWWDPRKRAAAGPDYGYPRFSTRALARCLQLGARTRDLARTDAPRAQRCTLVLNVKDPAIDNAAARDVFALWRRHAARADTYAFANLDARHDIVDPQTYPQARTLVYPVLLELIDRA